jgi:hypothetical protein
MTRSDYQIVDFDINFQIRRKSTFTIDYYWLIVAIEYFIL